MNGYDSKYINSIYPDLSAKGLMTGQCVYTTSGESLPSSFYYDVKERIVQKQSENIIQSFLSEYYQYSFTGKVQSHLCIYHTISEETLREEYKYDYDHAERLINVTHCLNNGEKVILSSNEYDELCKLKKEHFTITNSQLLIPTTSETG